MASQPVPSDSVETAKKSEQSLQEYVPDLLKGAGEYFKSNAFTDVASAANGILRVTTAFHESIRGTLDAHNITLDALSVELEGVFRPIADNLAKILPSKPPGHAERAKMVDAALDDVEAALIDLAARYRIDGEVVATYVRALRPHVGALTIGLGSINEKYPALFPSLAPLVAAMLIPQSWILGPFLSRLGFGIAGPIKGSAAAWMQSYFWGGAVRAGSWFATLQAAGMGVVPAWAGLVVKGPLVVGGLLATNLRYIRNRP